MLLLLCIILGDLDAGERYDPLSAPGTSPTTAYCLLLSRAFDCGGQLNP